jgi:RHS repeat-associated protein
LDFVRFGGRALSLYFGSETYLYHVNNLNSTAMTTNHAGTAVGDVVFYPWGDTWQQTGSGGYNFAGMPYYDTTTSTNETMYRFYSQNLGRWFSPDPLGGDITNPQSLNRYAYVMNNPTTLTDPLGLGQCPPGTVWVSCNPEQAAQSNLGGLLGGSTTAMALTTWTSLSRWTRFLQKLKLRQVTRSITSMSFSSTWRGLVRRSTPIRRSTPEGTPS